uniref:Immunoglobulin V-set domain-containing protein n=1 Tax=Electrophorus electricus TaxID=8005 RepID=A0A4W4F130_ELEEL
MFITMNLLHLLYITNTIICFAAGTGAVTTVTGYTGHSVQIRCPYESQYETRMKYLCGGEWYTFQTKDIPVDSKTAKDERFSLNDDTAARVFTVTITDLRSEDGGKYCISQYYTRFLITTKTGLCMDRQYELLPQILVCHRFLPSDSDNSTIIHFSYSTPTLCVSASVHTGSTQSGRLSLIPSLHNT